MEATGTQGRGSGRKPRKPWPWPGRPAGLVDDWALRRLLHDETGKWPSLRATREEMVAALRAAGFAVPAMGGMYDTIRDLRLGDRRTSPLSAADRRRISAALRQAEKRRDRSARIAHHAQATAEDEAALARCLTLMLDTAPGHVFGAARLTDQYERHTDPGCRVCGGFVSSIFGMESCPGDRHKCPAVLSDREHPPTAQRVHGDGRWRCYQPGVMNGDFTAWTCSLGHVTTPDSHKPKGPDCIPMHCPCGDLADGNER